MPRAYKTPPGRSEQARKAAFAAHQPLVLAKQLGKVYPSLSPEHQQEVLRELVRNVEQDQERGLTS
jgi:hypothetical protein